MWVTVLVARCWLRDTVSLLRLVDFGLESCNLAFQGSVLIAKLVLAVLMIYVLEGDPKLPSPGFIPYPSAPRHRAPQAEV